MRLSPDYYHCFLGNGLDAVLIGYTGAMVRDKVGVDRCAWYKSDRYYPEDRLVKVSGRFPMEKTLEHAPGSGWYEIAPLGRMWYEILVQGQPLTAQNSQQHFVPQEGCLYSLVDFSSLQVRVTTFMHASRSLLVVHVEAEQDIRLRSWMAPGVWVEEGWDTDPFCALQMADGIARGWYDLGETQGWMGLESDPAPLAHGGQGNERWLDVHGRTISLYFSIYDNRQGDLHSSSPLEQALSSGYEKLRSEHLGFWRNYFSTSNVAIPDEQLQRLYTSSMYHFKAMQNPVSGGLPVNNLRRTWSSHIFWDSYYLQRALLEANHKEEALEACRWFQRTEAAARRHAQEEFGCEGLKWDWEVTHDGRKAYGVLLHMKDQVHNNASYANEIFQYYHFTRDHQYLREFYPILEGLARFFLCNVIEESARGYETRPVVGVHESPIRVRNDGITVAGAAAILRHASRAAILLGMESDFSHRCDVVAAGLIDSLGRLYNGRFFVSSEGAAGINMSSFAPIYPMQVIPFDDPRSLSTSEAGFQSIYERRRSPWAAGVIATILAYQGKIQHAWQAIELVRPMMCSFGGLTEIMENGEWNMQYFGTAQGAVCTALHSLLLQERDGIVRLFPAIPDAWEKVSFDSLLAAGCEVSACIDRKAGILEGSLKNATSQKTVYNLQAGNEFSSYQLDAGESRAFQSEL